MKLHSKILSSLLVFLVLFTSCETNTEQPEIVKTNPYLELVGTVEHRQATAEELSKLVPTQAKANCTLHGDEGCSDDASSEFERFVKECTTYPRIWPPTGAVSTHYKSMIYYVDGDGDINLDHYQDDLQAHVNQLTSSAGAAFISANIVFWTCNERESNSCVLAYSVYR
ncbi:hypothetical protein [Aquimarina macrocephali]|uniref:hypothetical protein n=1 Tax=Aquimarina macrocephali TaxID=666563 RepID=UPI0004670B2B|nr:hypothetical protein [Aquimarina macrocephali]